MLNKWKAEGSREEISDYVQIFFHLPNFSVIQSFFCVILAMLYYFSMLGLTK